MNELLERRYDTLFLTYGVGAHPAILDVKRRIVELRRDNPGWLRADAAYFLLVNCDHMAFRSCSGLIASPEHFFEFHISPDDMGGRMQEALDIIINQLEQYGDFPATAHQVMRAIDGSWQSLADLFLW